MDNTQLPDVSSTVEKINQILAEDNCALKAFMIISEGTVTQDIRVVKLAEPTSIQEITAEEPKIVEALTNNPPKEAK